MCLITAGQKTVSDLDLHCLPQSVCPNILGKYSIPQKLLKNEREYLKIQVSGNQNTNNIQFNPLYTK